MNSQEIDEKLNDIDNKILLQIDTIDSLQVEKHNLEIKLMELTEFIRQGKKLLGKMKIEKEVLERSKWVELKKERGY